MNGNGQKTPATLGGSGGPEGNDGTRTNPIVPQLPDTCQAQATPTVWATVDAIHTVVRELLARGLVEDGPEIDQVITASWAKMGGASYLTRKDRKAWEVAEVTQ